MTKEKVGIRRLYDSIACGLSDRVDFEFACSLSQEFEATVYMGPKPRFGIAITSGGRYVTNLVSDSLTTFKYDADATQSGYPRSFFTEIAILRTIEVPEELSAAFHQADNTAQAEILSRANERLHESRTLIDLIAGTLGLRFHRQFVLESINENAVAIRDPILVQVIGDPLEVLEDIRLNSTGVSELTNFLTEIVKVEQAKLLEAGVVLSWLGRSWHERDPVYQFLSLFIPIERILQGHGGVVDSAFIENVQAIRELIHHDVGDDAGRLLTFFNSLAESKRPSLEDRFAQLAQQAAFAGWQSDVKAFHKFNRIRNSLIHRARGNVELQVSVADEEIRTLEDLVERYVSYFLFGDGRVYQSRWRPTRS